MSRLIRLDRTGHTELAEWTGTDADAAEVAAARVAFSDALAEGWFAVATGPDGAATQVHELPLDADLVVLRRPIAGG